jgi:hypothetical protein
MSASEYASEYASDYSASDSSDQKWIISQLRESGKSIVSSAERIGLLNMEKDYHLKMICAAIPLTATFLWNS